MHDVSKAAILADAIVAGRAGVGALIASCVARCEVARRFTRRIIILREAVVKLSSSLKAFCGKAFVGDDQRKPGLPAAHLKGHAVRSR